MRLGDLDALKKTFENACIYGLPMNELYGAILKIIDNAPTVDLWQMRQEATENALKKAEVLYARPQGDLISRSEAEKLGATCLAKRNENGQLEAIISLDNAPTVTVETDEYGREHFKGICPYTNTKCEKWTCSVCEVEERERKFMEGDTD